jgi:hypothetical protein
MLSRRVASNSYVYNRVPFAVIAEWRSKGGETIRGEFQDTLAAAPPGPLSCRRVRHDALRG